MAAANVEEEVTCCVCRNIYRDPVTLPCGHSVCIACVCFLWDFEGFGDEDCYICPKCEQRYSGSPEAKLNHELCNSANRFLRSHQRKGDTRIFCCQCDPPVPATKSCVQCEVSLCDTHMGDHSDPTQHSLIAPTHDFSDRKCSVHHQILEYYCWEDLAFMCESCSLSGGHRGHRVQRLDEASEAKKGKLKEILHKLTPKTMETDQKIQSLSKHKKIVKKSAKNNDMQVTKLFRDIREQLENLEEKIVTEIIEQRKKGWEMMSDLIDVLQNKKYSLEWKIVQYGRLCASSDHVTVLREQEAEAEALCGVEEEDNVADGKKLPVVGDLDERLISGKLSAAITDVTNVIHAIGIYGREATGLSLDTDTASNNLALSHNRKSVSHTHTRQNLPQTPGRFQVAQALCTRSFSSGKHYWEVEGSETGGWRIGVAYPSIDREGDQSYIGFNNKSWALCKFYNNYSVIHNGERKGLAMPPSCQRIRIFLDYEAGCLSFYELSYPIRHLHTFTASFSEPLQPVLWVAEGGGWVRMLS
ncbi:hypothetical protein XENTR_v10015685 [Xenopus tropicalis]|uniref:E3 ubiquitin-protein ligase TRIM39 n=1 Tax=Xenopus tropicalis TaxID=8364 RepID=A0A1B8Y3F0_XENTR|nr:E3 ubiquitin-protein ligase TRIM39 [Xenopus tropicalis]KAE8595300.1 hypothetical protein XENTR_v10015685 [Xenopus tropicalis]|eukprot:XP_004919612.1 PREDICTED: E3 ubiquitin-protein ligase TRIM39-like [Xenopus tropicalis]